MGLFRDNEPIIPMKHNMAKNPNEWEENRLGIYKRGRGFEDLNSELPRTNPARGIWTRGLRIPSSAL